MLEDDRKTTYEVIIRRYLSLKKANLSLKKAINFFNNIGKKISRTQRCKLLWDSQEKGTYIKSKHGELK